MKLAVRRRPHRSTADGANQRPRTTRGRHLEPTITKATIKAERAALPVSKGQLLVELDRLYRLPLRQPPLFHPPTNTVANAERAYEFTARNRGARP